MPSHDRPDATSSSQQHGQAPRSLTGSTLDADTSAHGRPLTTDTTAHDGTQPTVAELVDKVFSRFDANADGSITLEEALNAIDPRGVTSDLVVQFTHSAASLDGDADGSLSKEELTAAITAQSQAAHQLIEAATWADHAANDEEFGDHPSKDGDAEGSSGNVMMSLFGSSGRPIDFAAMASSVFAQIDSNADNTLSADEVAAAVALVDAGGFDSSVISTLDTSAIASLVTAAAHPDQPLDHFDQLSVELIGVLARALNPHDCGG